MAGGMIVTAGAPAAARAPEREVAERALRVAWRTALGVLGDREAAADVAQEVALVAVRRHDQLRDPAALDAWLHRTAVRAALREGRRGARRRAAEAAAADLEGSDTAGAPGLKGSDPFREEEDAAARLLRVLPPRQRAALTLRYVHDLDDAAIARALGCRPGTVRSLLSRGREALRGHVDSPGDHR